MRLLYAAAGLAALLAPLPAAAQDWYRIVHTEKLTDYVDADTIHKDGEWTVARVMTIYGTPQQYDVKSMVVDLQMDCSARQLRIAHITVFNAEGSSLANSDWPDDAKRTDIEPNTPFDLLAAFICGTERKGTRVTDPKADEAGL